VLYRAANCSRHSFTGSINPVRLLIPNFGRALQVEFRADFLVAQRAAASIRISISQAAVSAL